ncbi:hypothetical protein CGQ24_09255 [Arthrobacter sp. 7749]|nr:hypothetical protein CGQ24_09255 [Arthrobacter sp. 7749]
MVGAKQVGGNLFRPAISVLRSCDQSPSSFLDGVLGVNSIYGSDRLLVAVKRCVVVQHGQ